VFQALFEYNPVQRINAINACSMPYFYVPRNKETVLPSGHTLPEELFTFTEREMALASHEAKWILLDSSTAATNNPPPEVGTQGDPL
jgi:hypothetical protein